VAGRAVSVQRGRSVDPCFGPLEVLVDGVLATLGGIKQRIVLAVLALRVNSEVSRNVLIEAVWADQPPDRPSGVL
jgi:DNA-binding SARP family transcriptional activator